MIRELKTRTRLAVILITGLTVLGFVGTPSAFATVRPDSGTIKPTGAELSSKVPRQAVASLFTSQVAHPGVTGADLSQWTPPVDPLGQGQVNSCSAWATAYYLRYWLEYHDSGMKITSDSFSPMYQYWKIDAGQNKGTTIADNFLKETQFGAEPDSLYSRGVQQGKTDYTHAPASADDTRAAAYKLAGHPVLLFEGANKPGSWAAVTGTLDSGRPLVLAIPVYSDFNNASPSTFFITPHSGTPLGLHAVFAYGYDKADGGIWIDNSWGTGWGRGGTAKLSKSFVQQDVLEAWTVPDPLLPGPGRAIALNGNGTGGYKLDGYGTVRPFGTLYRGGPGTPNVVNGSTSGHYWPGWDIARDIALRPDGKSGYVLDGWGGIHPFGGVPGITNGPYWRGWDIARRIVLRPQGDGGYVLDGFGGIHPFGSAPYIAVDPHSYWQGWDIARDIVLRADGKSGYVLDGWGGIHPFGGAPGISNGPYWHGWDIARAITLLGDGQSGYVLDGWGGISPFGGAPARSTSEWIQGQDFLARDIAMWPFKPGQAGIQGVWIDSHNAKQTFGP